MIIELINNKNEVNIISKDQIKNTIQAKPKLGSLDIETHPKGHKSQERMQYPKAA